ncbi:MAG TPA: hypothetical protein VI584_07615, partial [Nitrospiria bacterium]|nr:hypothetical protein [Nitrospiria bacterium]
FPGPIEPPGKTRTELLESRTWRITLSWSEEALEQAAYTMTFWYMAQVGKHVYAKKELPKGWEDMSNEEAGMNAVKQMLYFLPLRYLTSRQEKKAIWLYNIYGFGYVAGVDAEEMLWPEDFASYKIDEEVVKRLASASVPEKIIQKMKSLMPIQMTGEMNFRECLKSVLSEEELKNNKSVILKNSEFFPESDWVG